MKVHVSPTVEAIPQLSALDPSLLHGIRVASLVFPFRVNAYVIDELIDWSNAPDDPLFRMVFPHPEMLAKAAYDELDAAYTGKRPDLKAVQRRLREDLNPHPAGQLEMNRPLVDGDHARGLQHKYGETVLFFPRDGQTCHSFCSFCFRWPQFVRERDWQIATSDRNELAQHLRAHPGVTDLLVTGGDALTVKPRRMRFYLESLLGPDLAHVTNVRFGTKALSFWPFRVTTDKDAGEFRDMLRWLLDAGKHVTIMAHYNHWRELATPAAEEAIRTLRECGVTIRSQGPILRGVNDDPDVWRELWARQVRMGIVPYYMYLARDTGAHDFFSVPLAEAWRIFAEAAKEVSGLARTVRGPVMSTTSGKVEVTGVTSFANQKVFVLRFLQARDPDRNYKPFFAKFDERATWFDELVPADEISARFFPRAEDASSPVEQLASYG